MSGLNINVEMFENNSLVPKLKGKKNPALKGEFNLEKKQSGPRDVKSFLEKMKADTDEFIQDKLDLMNPLVMTEEERLELEAELEEFKLAYKKALSGVELTVEEMKLMAKFSPVMYRILIEAKIVREAYEQQLKNCKSKEEVANLKLAYDLACAKNIKLAKAAGDEIEYTRQVIFKNTIDDEHEKFVETKEYMRLPNKVKKDDKVDKNKIDIPFEKVLVNNNVKKKQDNNRSDIEMLLKELKKMKHA